MLKLSESLFYTIFCLFDVEVKRSERHRGGVICVETLSHDIDLQFRAIRFDIIKADTGE